MITKSELKEQLQNNIMNVCFEKKDGTKRDMLCTLIKDYLPEREQKEVVRTKKENTDVLPVWDLDKKAFRSVRMNTLISHHVSEPYEL
jgi:hypothetical protein